MITIDPPSSSLPHHLAPSKSSLTRFLRRAQTAVGLPGEISLLLTDDASMRRLNRSFRGKNNSTDVLSFPAPEIPGLPPEQRPAGDLAISLEVAARQATAFEHTLAAELRLLILHGLLHLAGFDHETDAGQMAARERALRSELRLSSSLLARAAETGAAAKRPRRARA